MQLIIVELKARLPLIEGKGNRENKWTDFVNINP